MTENVVEFHDPNLIEEEAATWLIKFDSDMVPTEEDRVAFQEWLARSPAHRDALNRLSKHWQGDSVLAELAIPLVKSPKRSHKWFFSGLFQSRWSFSTIGAIATILVLSLYVILAPSFNKVPVAAENNLYTTAIGEQEVNTLADGSVLQLNTDTRIQTSYNDDARKIQLLQGEAHFDVATDPDRPFEVYAGERIVQAIGTAFTVLLVGDIMKVTVTEGEVNLVTAPTEPALKIVESSQDSKVERKTDAGRLGSLKAGQSATVSDGIDEVRDLDESELTSQLAWRSGMLVFAGDPLREVVRQINRYTPMTIEITDPALGDLEIGARFRIDDLESIFDVLEVNFGIQISRLDDLHIQLRSRKKGR